MNQYPLLAYISLFSVIFPIGVGISKMFNLHHGMGLLFYYLVFALVADVYLLWFVNGPQLNLALVHTYYLIEYIFIMSIITVWQESLKTKRYFQALILFYIILWIAMKFSFEPLSGLYSVTASISQVILTLGSGYTLFVVIGNRTQPLINHYRFWVLLSFVVYYAGTLVITALRGILIHYSSDIFLLAASLDWSLKILFNILFAIGFLCSQTQT
jgi:hypothetical protein